MTTSPPALILASTSPYRRQLLSRLQLPFIVANPNVDETPQAEENAAATAMRLAEEKARAVAPQFPNALIIGADQVAHLDGEPLEKPGCYARATTQLQRMRGRTILFYTALCLLDTRDMGIRRDSVTTEVHMRHYSDAMIKNYLEAEQPYDCAGSAKMEGLGIVLMAAIHTPDPSALIGLPLIALVDMLNSVGYGPLQ